MVKPISSSQSVNQLCCPVMTNFQWFPLVGCKANLLLSLLVNEGNLTCNNHWWWWWWLTTHMHALWVDNGNIGLHIGIGTHQTHYGTGLATFLVRTSPSDQAQVTFSIDHDIRLGYRSFFVMGKMVQIVNKFEQNISKQLKQSNNVNASSASWPQFPGEGEDTKVWIS